MVVLNIRQLALPCQCAGTCTIALILEFDSFQDEPLHWWVDMYTTGGNARNWRWKFSQFWKILRNKDDAYRHGVLLYEPQIKELQEFICGVRGI